VMGSTTRYCFEALQVSKGAEAFSGLYLATKY
jgi:hypothetical protein